MVYGAEYSCSHGDSRLKLLYCLALLLFELSLFDELLLHLCQFCFLGLHQLDRLLFVHFGCIEALLQSRSEFE